MEIGFMEIIAVIIIWASTGFIGFVIGRRKGRKDQLTKQEQTTVKPQKNDKQKK